MICWIDTTSWLYLTKLQLVLLVRIYYEVVELVITFETNTKINKFWLPNESYDYSKLQRSSKKNRWSLCNNIKLKYRFDLDGDRTWKLFVWRKCRVLIFLSNNVWVTSIRLFNQKLWSFYWTDAKWEKLVQRATV